MAAVDRYQWAARPGHNPFGVGLIYTAIEITRLLINIFTVFPQKTWDVHLCDVLCDAVS
jgi:hypothetical protein